MKPGSAVDLSREIETAANIICDGGVVAYPTEGVFGLGCLPGSVEAVKRILDIKQRDAAKGLLLIASGMQQLTNWIRLPDNNKSLESDPSKPITWIVPATKYASRWVRGEHDGVAVRLTRHPIARALCDASDSALVSTSANISGEEPVREFKSLNEKLITLVDYVVPGECGDAEGPSEIRHLDSGHIVRPG